MLYKGGKHTETIQVEFQELRLGYMEHSVLGDGSGDLRIVYREDEAPDNPLWLKSSLLSYSHFHETRFD